MEVSNQTIDERIDEIAHELHWSHFDTIDGTDGCDATISEAIKAIKALILEAETRARIDEVGIALSLQRYSNRSEFTLSTEQFLLVSSMDRRLAELKQQLKGGE